MAETLTSHDGQKRGDHEGTSGPCFGRRGREAATKVGGQLGWEAGLRLDEQHGPAAIRRPNLEQRIGSVIEDRTLGALRRELPASRQASTEGVEASGYKGVV